MIKKNDFMEKIFDLPCEIIKLLSDSNLLKIYIEKQLIIKYTRDISVTIEEEKSLIEIFYNKNYLNNPKRLAKYIFDNDMLNQNELNVNLISKYKIKKYANEYFEDNARDFFFLNKNDMDQFSYNILRVTDSNLAFELYFQIESKESDFSKLARVYSEGIESFSGGFIALTNLRNTHPLLKAKLYSTSVGVLTEPFNIDKWWILIKKERFEPAKFDLNTKSLICLDLFKQSIKKEALDIIERLSYKFHN